MVNIEEPETFAILGFRRNQEVQGTQGSPKKCKGAARGGSFPGEAGG
jgi:hypothetical protein